MRPRWIHLALLFALAAALAAVWVRGQHQLEDRTAVLAALREARGPHLPGATRANASAATEPLLYGADTLSELIDGAAEAYLAHGFEKCAAVTYTFAAGGREKEVAAEVHRFRDESGARAQLEAERPRGARPLAVPAGALSDGSVLVLVNGRDLLKLTRLDAPGEGEDPLAGLAAAWLEEKKP